MKTETVEKLYDYKGLTKLQILLRSSVPKGISFLIISKILNGKYE